MTVSLNTVGVTLPLNTVCVTVSLNTVCDCVIEHCVTVLLNTVCVTVLLNTVCVTVPLSCALHCLLQTEGWSPESVTTMLQMTSSGPMIMMVSCNTFFLSFFSISLFPSRSRNP